MRLLILSSALALLLSTSTVLADTLPSPTPSATTPDDYRAETTPFPHPELVSDDDHLEIRQIPAQIPDPVVAPGQVPPVTVYSIATQIGATGVQTVVTYTQLFSAVPEQWPAAQSGVIGYGNLQKREVEARETEMRVLDVEQPVVLVQEVELVTMPVQSVMEVLVVEGVVVSNLTVVNNGTRPAEARNGSAPALVGTAPFGPLYTAAGAASERARPSSLAR